MRSQLERVHGSFISKVDGLVDRAVEDERRRNLVSRRYSYLLAACILLAVTAGYVAVDAHTQPEITEQEAVATWGVSASFTHSAEVQRDTVLHSEGTLLENQPAYFTNVTPVVDLQHRFSHVGDEAEAASVDVTVTRHLRSVDEEDVYWSETEVVSSQSTRSLEAGETLESEFSVDVSEAADAVEEIESDLGASPGTAELAFDVDYTVEATVAGEEQSVEHQDTVVLRPDRFLVQVSSSTMQSDETVTRTVTRPAETSLLSGYLSVLVALSAAVAALALYRGRRREAFTLPDDVRRRLEYERQRDDLDEWISRGTASLEERDTVELESLEDVVDVAIDCDRRVVERIDADAEYVAVVDDVAYLYRAPPEI